MLIFRPLNLVDGYFVGQGDTLQIFVAFVGHPKAKLSSASASFALHLPVTNGSVSGPS